MVSTRQMSITTVGPEAGKSLLLRDSISILFAFYLFRFNVARNQLPDLFVIWLWERTDCILDTFLSLCVFITHSFCCFWFDWFCNGRSAKQKESPLKISILLHLCVIFFCYSIPFYLCVCLFVEILGSSGVNANGGSSRMTSNTLSQQSSSSNTPRQQSNHGSVDSTATGDATHSNMGCVIVPTCQIQLQLTDMPVEIFERIFQYTGYKEVSNMRLVNDTKHIYSNQKCDSAQIVNVFHFAIFAFLQVSTQTNQICKTILNSTFTKLQTQLMKRFQNIKKIMPRR